MHFFLGSRRRGLILRWISYILGRQFPSVAGRIGIALNRKLLMQLDRKNVALCNLSRILWIILNNLTEEICVIHFLLSSRHWGLIFEVWFYDWNHTFWEVDSYQRISSSPNWNWMLLMLVKLELDAIDASPIGIGCYWCKPNSKWMLLMQLDMNNVVGYDCLKEYGKETLWSLLRWGVISRFCAAEWI